MSPLILSPHRYSAASHSLASFHILFLLLVWLFSRFIPAYIYHYYSAVYCVGHECAGRQENKENHSQLHAHKHLQHTHTCEHTHTNHFGRNDFVVSSCQNYNVLPIQTFFILFLPLSLPPELCNRNKLKTKSYLQLSVFFSVYSLKYTV